MNDTKIGIQGGKGSFSELAAQQFIQMHKINNPEIVFLINSENVLSAINNDDVDHGIFAIENAQGGVVIESIHALAHHNCNILSLFHVEISQNLLVLPGTRMTDIKEIRSHQQALRQCRNYLADHFWSCQLIEEDDTAESARRLHSGDYGSETAVIANEFCAELYELELLTKDIQDLKHNLTLFAAVEKLG